MSQHHLLNNVSFPYWFAKPLLSFVKSTHTLACLLHWVAAEETESWKRQAGCSTPCSCGSLSKPRHGEEQGLSAGIFFSSFSPFLPSFLLRVFLPAPFFPCLSFFIEDRLTFQLQVLFLCMTQPSERSYSSSKCFVKNMARKYLWCFCLAGELNAWLQTLSVPQIATRLPPSWHYRNRALWLSAGLSASPTSAFASGAASPH
nr:uncharacterized protein LOC112428586 isoform X3 [Macaca nemestrina]